MAGRRIALVTGAIEAILDLTVGVSLILLVHWSYQMPRKAFLASFLTISAAAVLAMIVDRPLLLLPGFMVLFSSYFAYEAARKEEEAGGDQRQT